MAIDECWVGFAIRKGLEPSQRRQDAKNCIRIEQLSLRLGERFHTLLMRGVQGLGTADIRDQRW